LVPYGNDRPGESRCSSAQLQTSNRGSLVRITLEAKSLLERDDNHVLALLSKVRNPECGHHGVIAAERNSAATTRIEGGR